MVAEDGKCRLTDVLMTEETLRLPSEVYIVSEVEHVLAALRTDEEQTT